MSPRIKYKTENAVDGPVNSIRTHTTNLRSFPKRVHFFPFFKTYIQWTHKNQAEENLQLLLLLSDVQTRRETFIAL